MPQPVCVRPRGQHHPPHSHFSTYAASACKAMPVRSNARPKPRSNGANDANGPDMEGTRTQLWSPLALAATKPPCGRVPYSPVSAVLGQVSCHPDACFQSMEPME